MASDLPLRARTAGDASFALFFMGVGAGIFHFGCKVGTCAPYAAPLWLRLALACMVGSFVAFGLFIRWGETAATGGDSR